MYSFQTNSTLEGLDHYLVRLKNSMTPCNPLIPSKKCMNYSLGCRISRFGDGKEWDHSIVCVDGLIDTLNERCPSDCYIPHILSNILMRSAYDELCPSHFCGSSYSGRCCLYFRGNRAIGNISVEPVVATASIFQ